MKFLLLILVAFLPASYCAGYTFPSSNDNGTLNITADHTNETCNLDNGTITINIIGSDTTGVTYSIDDITYTSNPLFTDLEADDYLVIAKGPNGCFGVTSVQIEDLEGPELMLAASCVPDRNRITIISEVETRIPVSFNWEGPNNYTSSDSIILSTQPGTYNLTVTDDLGCSTATSVTLEACCSLELSCNLPPIVETCISEAPDPNPTLLDPTASKQEMIDALVAEGIVVDTGFCGALKVVIIDTPVVPADCNDDLVIARVYTISDNESSLDCNQQINLKDYITIEIIEAAQDLSVTCDSDYESEFDMWLESNGGMRFNGCSNPYAYSTMPTLVSADDIFCGQELEVTFTATDACGNNATSTAFFSVTDNEDPIINCPTNIEVNPVDPGLENDLNTWLESVQVSDNCGENPATNNLDIALIGTECNDPAQIDVLFLTEDDCGNTADCISTINVVSPSAATLNCGEDISIQCDDDRMSTIEEWIDKVTAEDPNGNVITVSNDLDITTTTQLSCGESVDVIFSIIDDCNRTLECTRSISITDAARPDLTCPPNLTLAASDLDGSTEVLEWAESVSAVDNCTPDLLVLNNLSQDFSDLCQISDVTEVIFTVADDCGNEAECLATISIIRDEPSIICPEELVVECGDSDMMELISDWLEEVTAMDNGTNPITNDYSVLVAQGGCEETLPVLFSTLDNCGKEVSCESTIKFVDTQIPDLTCPQAFVINIEISSLSSDINQWLETISVSDCNNVELDNNLDSEFIASVICTETFAVNFEAIDDCGNVNVCETSLTLENLSSLEVSCPDRIELICSDPQMNLKIEEHLEQVIVETGNEYTISENISSDLTTVSCLNSESLEIEVYVVDVCENEGFCLTGIDFRPDPEIYIPNVFSPDGDGYNDYFTAYGNESVDYIASMDIFNRWGSKIYTSENIEINEEFQGWDGTYAGQKEKTEVFTYYMKIVDLFGNEIEKVGTLQILRN